MKYFTELKLSGYKSIQDVTVKLHPGINIFIGPNGSGKSNLLTFISYLKDEVPALGASYNIDSTWTSNDVVFSKSVSQKFSSNTIDLVSKNNDSANRTERWSNLVLKSNNYKLEKNGETILDLIYGRTSSISNEEIRHDLRDQKIIGDLISAITFIRFTNEERIEFLSHPKTIKLEVDEIWSSMMDWSGSLFSPIIGLSLIGVASLEPGVSFSDYVKFINRAFSVYSEEVTVALKKHTPVKDVGIKDIISVNNKNGQLAVENFQIEFLLKDGWYSWDDLSDGTKRMISIIHHVYFSSDVVLIEEPELGIHPHQLHKLLDFLKEQAYTKQIIISTHSPEVLDVLSSEQLDNINLVSNKKGRTVVRKLSKSQKEKARDYLEETGSIGDYCKYSDLEV